MIVNSSLEDIAFYVAKCQNKLSNIIDYYLCYDIYIITTIIIEYLFLLYHYDRNMTFELIYFIHIRV